MAEGVKLLTPVSSKHRRGPSLIRYSLSQQSSLLEIGGASSFAALGDRMGAGFTASGWVLALRPWKHWVMSGGALTITLPAPTTAYTPPAYTAPHTRLPRTLGN